MNPKKEPPEIEWPDFDEILEEDGEDEHPFRTEKDEEENGTPFE